MKDKTYGITELQRLMERLRDPDTGCPWDLKQTYQSIAPFTLEECLELIDALEQNDFDHVEEELGDLLFQVIFYAQLGKEEGRLTSIRWSHTSQRSCCAAIPCIQRR